MERTTSPSGPASFPAASIMAALKRLLSPGRGSVARGFCLIMPYAAWMAMMAILPQTAYFYALRGAVTALMLFAVPRAYDLVFRGIVDKFSLRVVGANAFRNCPLTITELPSGITTIGNSAFQNCTSLTELTFLGTPTSIGATAFQGCANLATVRVPWAEGAVANAPWGATNATITYNYTPQ